MKDSETLTIETEMGDMPSGKKGGSKFHHVLYILIILILLGGVGYIYTLYNEKVEEIAVITETIYQVNAEKEILNAQLDSLEAEIAIYMGENEKLDSLLIEKQQEIEKIRVILRSQKADMRAVQDLRDKIAVLEQTSKKLIDENMYLKYRVDSLQTVTAAKQQKIDTMEVIDFQKTRQLEELSEKVEMGAQIRVGDMKILTYNRRGKLMTRAKRVTNFEITGTMLKNVLAEPGKKTMYIRITAPNGVVLTTEPTNQFEYEGKSIMFTERREVSYNNKDVNFEVYYNAENDALEAGSYSVVVFCNGKEVGKSEITLN